ADRVRELRQLDLDRRRRCAGAGPLGEIKTGKADPGGSLTFWTGAINRRRPNLFLRGRQRDTDNLAIVPGEEALVGVGWVRPENLSARGRTGWFQNMSPVDLVIAFRAQ